MVVGVNKKVELLTSCFRVMFVPAGLPYKAKVYPPTEIRTPFTGGEVQTSGKKLKNRKSNNGLNTICS